MVYNLFCIINIEKELEQITKGLIKLLFFSWARYSLFSWWYFQLVIKFMGQFYNVKHICKCLQKKYRKQAQKRVYLYCAKHKLTNELTEKMWILKKKTWNVLQTKSVRKSWYFNLSTMTEKEKKLSLTYAYWEVHILTKICTAPTYAMFHV